MSELGVWQGFVGHGQIIGERSSQQDYYFVCPLLEADGSETILLVLTDGMGGHSGGEVASQISAQAFVETFADCTEAGMPILERHEAAIVAANRSIREFVAQRPDLEGMGCTLVGLYWDGNGASWTSIGDSPMWFLSRTKDRQYRMDRANADHSLKPIVEKQLAAGLITPEEAEQMPVNQLLSALVGDTLEVKNPDKVDIQADPPMPLSEGSYILIASDGIDTLSDKEVQKTLVSSKNPEAALSDLLNKVEHKNRPHQDNTTALVLRIPKLKLMSRPASQAQKRTTMPVGPTGPQTTRQQAAYADINSDAAAKDDAKRKRVAEKFSGKKSGNLVRFSKEIFVAAVILLFLFSAWMFYIALNKAVTSNVPEPSPELRLRQPAPENETPADGNPDVLITPLNEPDEQEMPPSIAEPAENIGQNNASEPDFNDVVNSAAPDIESDAGEPAPPPDQETTPPANPE